MRLVFLIYNTRNPAGGSYSIFKFAEYLANRGHNVTIFADLKPIYFYNHQLPKTIEIKYRGSLYGLFKGSSMLDQIWRFFYKKIVIEPFLKKNPIDFIIGFLRQEAITVVKLSKKFKIASVNFIFENPLWMERVLGQKFIKEYKGKFKRSWKQTEIAYKQSDILLPNSELTRFECSIWLNRQIHEPIYPGVSVPENLKEIKEEYQIIYVGRLNEYKNVNEIIEALANINNPPKFVIVGSGEEHRKLKILAKINNVKCEFKGRLTDREKWVEIKKSLFMVFPTSFEGFGMPPMEALYCGVPCVCTDIPILREIYDNKVEFFREHDVEDLSNKMKFLIANPKYRKKRGKEGKKYIISKYTWEKAAKNIETVLIKHKGQK